MSTRLQVLVYENRQLKESSEFDGPVELGRQRDRDEGLFSRKRENDTWRWVIARRDETTVGRNQLRLEPLPDDKVQVTNGSDKQPIRFLDRADLQPGASCEAKLPVLVILGPSRTVRVQRAVVGGHLNSLADATIPPRVSVSSRLPSLLAAPGGQVATREMISWLHSAMDVLQAAADSADFFDRAARAVVDTVALDAARVLLRVNGEWKTKTVQTANQTDSAAMRKPSESVLEKVLQDKRTWWEDAVGVHSTPSESLHGVEMVVAAPILNRSGEVIGALYGERNRGPRLGGNNFTDLEAMLVELLARGVAAGLARLEEERKALQQRVQFEQFFSPDLAGQLVSTPALLEGQDREVTVLFCDIRGFSRISEKLGAARTIPWCRDVLDVLSEAVFNEEGVVIDYVGDGLMAMWGAPKDQPDHPIRACRAARAILAGLPALNEHWQAVLPRPMGLGIGINTGAAQVGNVGARRKFKYGALGPTVNIASRVQGATKYFKCPVLLTGATYERLDPSFLARRMGRVKVVGIEQGIDLYELFADDCPFALDGKCEYEKALALFEDKQFTLAARTLGNWRGQAPTDDGVLVLLLRAVKAMVEGTPPNHPVWELTEK
jgi:adenylate cyclase